MAKTVFFVGWVPNRQNQSPTDEMAPAPLQNTHLPSPKDTWDPKQGSVGPHLACDQIWSAGISSKTAPNTGKIHFLAFLARFGRRTGRRIFSKAPRHPKTSKSRIAAAGGRTIVSRGCTKVAQLERASDEPIFLPKIPGGAELRPKRFFCRLDP